MSSCALRPDFGIFPFLNANVRVYAQRRRRRCFEIGMGGSKIAISYLLFVQAQLQLQLQLPIAWGQHDDYCRDHADSVIDRSTADSVIDHVDILEDSEWINSMSSPGSAVVWHERLGCSSRKQDRLQGRSPTPKTFRDLRSSFRAHQDMNEKKLNSDN